MDTNWEHGDGPIDADGPALEDLLRVARDLRSRADLIDSITLDAEEESGTETDSDSASW